jgi:hypothetical protein
MPDPISDHEMVKVVKAAWQDMSDIMDKAIADCAALLEAKGVDDNDAFKIAHLLAQHAIFWDHAIMTAVVEVKGDEKDRSFGGGQNFMKWVKQEYKAWDRECWGAIDARRQQ